jgi:tellurite resistance protein
MDLLTKLPGQVLDAAKSFTGPADPNAEVTRLEGEVDEARTKLAELEQKLKEAKEKVAQAGLAVASANGGRRKKTRRSTRSRSGRKSIRS